VKQLRQQIFREQRTKEQTQLKLVNLTVPAEVQAMKYARLAKSSVDLRKSPMNTSQRKRDEAELRNKRTENCKIRRPMNEPENTYQPKKRQTEEHISRGDCLDRKRFEERTETQEWTNRGAHFPGGLSR